MFDCPPGCHVNFNRVYWGFHSRTKHSFWHNYAYRQRAGSQQSVQALEQKIPPLPGLLVAYWPIPNRDLSLAGRVILLTMVSNLLTGARLYEFSRHLVYYLWYTLANSLMGFWNRLNPTIAMAGHLFRHSTSTIGTTTPPNIYVWGKL